MTRVGAQTPNGSSRIAIRISSNMEILEKSADWVSWASFRAQRKVSNWIFQRQNTMQSSWHSKTRCNESGTHPSVNISASAYLTNEKFRLQQNLNGFQRDPEISIFWFLERASNGRVFWLKWRMQHKMRTLKFKYGPARIGKILKNRRRKGPAE